VYEWDEGKRGKNLAKHGVDFSAMESFDWDEALIELDQRKHYGENRFRALGSIGDRLYSVCFVIRHQSYRIISLRKANQREYRKCHAKPN